MRIDFPGKDHVQEVCKLGSGAATCRYLTLGNGWVCTKGTSSGRQIEERAKPLVAQGDNCSGIIAWLCDGRLVGKRVFHRETEPTVEMMGTVLSIRISNGGMLELSADWGNGQEEKFSTALGYLNVMESGGVIIIRAAFPGGNTWEFR